MPCFVAAKTLYISRIGCSMSSDDRLLNDCCFRFMLGLFRVLVTPAQKMYSRMTVFRRYLLLINYNIALLLASTSNIARFHIYGKFPLN